MDKNKYNDTLNQYEVHLGRKLSDEELKLASYFYSIGFEDGKSDILNKTHKEKIS